MIQLFVNNTECILPENFSLSFVQENPAYSDAKEWTFDIELSLLAPTNAKVFSHISRVANEARPEGFTASIVQNGKLVVSGDVILLDWSDSSVSFQIVHRLKKQSLLNNQTRLRDAISTQLQSILPSYPLITSDLGYPFYVYNRNRTPSQYAPTIPDLAPGFVIPHLVATGNGESGNEHIYCYPSIKTKDNDKVFMLNAYMQTFVSESDGYVGDYQKKHGILNNENYIMIAQLYLEAVVRFALDGIGLKLRNNAPFQSALFKYLYVVSPQAQPKYKVPDWTVGKLLQEVSKFMCVTFIQDGDYVDCEWATFYGDVLTEIVLEGDEVFPQFSAEKINAPDEAVNYSKIAFKLNDSTYNKYQSISADVFRKLIRPFDSVSKSPTETYKWAIGRDFPTLAYNKNDGVSDYHFIMTDKFHFCLSFQNTDFDQDADDAEILSIVPAELCTEFCHPYSSFDHLKAQMPVVSYTGQLADIAINKFNIQDAIENGIEEPKTDDIMQVAYYHGLAKAFAKRVSPEWNETRYDEYTIITTNETYPHSGTTEYIMEMDYPLPSKILRGRDLYTPEKTLRIDSLDRPLRRLYAGKDKSRFEEEVTLTLYTDKMLDPSSLFIINGRKYICKSLEWTIDAEVKSKKIVKGIFWPISSDRY
jgi:hypothetical protein